MSFINKYVTPYIGTAVVVLVVMAGLVVISKKAPSLTKWFGY